MRSRSLPTSLLLASLAIPLVVLSGACKAKTYKLIRDAPDLSDVSAPEAESPSQTPAPSGGNYVTTSAEFRAPAHGAPSQALSTVPSVNRAPPSDNVLLARKLRDIVTDMAGDEVAWAIQHGVVVVTTKDKARGKLALRMYDVHLLTMQRTSFRAPDIGRVGISGGYDDDDERFGGSEVIEPAVTGDALVALIQDNIDPASWSEEGPSIDFHQGMLIVRQTPAVHFEIQVLLARLGAG